MLPKIAVNEIKELQSRWDVPAEDVLYRLRPGGEAAVEGEAFIWAITPNLNALLLSSEEIGVKKTQMSQLAIQYNPKFGKDVYLGDLLWKIMHINMRRFIVISLKRIRFIFLKA